MNIRLEQDESWCVTLSLPREVVPQGAWLVGLDIRGHLVENLLCSIRFARVGLEDGYDFDFAGHGCVLIAVPSTW